MSLLSTHTEVATYLQRCTQKDPGSLQTLIHTYGPTLHRYACGLFTKSHAEQLTQDGFALIWQHANLYRPEQGDALGWIMSIFRYRLAQALGSTRYQRAQAQSIDQLLKLKLADSSFAKAFDALSPTQQKLLLGRYLFAWDNELSVLHTGLSEHEVKQEVQRACYTLSSYLQPWQVTDLEWQTKNAQACVEGLRPQTEVSSLHQRRQTDAAALADTLRWEALCAQWCHVLPKATVNEQWLTALGNRLGIRFPIVTPGLPRKASRHIAESRTTLKAPQQPRGQSYVSDSAPIPSNVLKKEATSSELNPSGEPTNIKQKQLKAETKTESTVAPSAVKHVEAQQTNKNEATLGLALRKEQRSTFYWKLFSLINLVLLIGVLIWNFLPKPPPIEVIQMAPRLGAVLQAPGHSATPGWVLSVDPQEQVLLIPLVETELKENERVHLWTRNDKDPQMRSLGLIEPNQPVTLTRDIIGPVQEGQLFEMTLETKDAANTKEPQGPILFMGRIVSLGKYQDDEPQS